MEALHVITEGDDFYHLVSDEAPHHSHYSLHHLCVLLSTFYPKYPQQTFPCVGLRYRTRMSPFVCDVQENHVTHKYQ